MHDRLPARREEHPGQELPRTSPSAPGRDRAPADDGDRRCARAGGGYAVDTVRTGASARRRRIARSPPSRSCSPPGTLRHPEAAARAARHGALPSISARLGLPDPHELRGARSASRHAHKPAGATTPQGVAITSSWHPDEDTHIEPCRYGKGSNAMGLLNTMHDRRRHAAARAGCSSLRRAAAAPADAGAAARPAALVGAGDHPAGHAVAGQLDHGAAQAHAGSASPADLDARATASRTRPGSRRRTEAAAQLAENIGGDPGRHLGRPDRTSR